MITDKIRLGFSTGILRKTHTMKEALKTMQELNYDMVELGQIYVNQMDEEWLNEITRKDLEGFEYVSCHAPKFNYGENKQTKQIFEMIKRINSIRELDTVVFHPDQIEDFEVFQGAPFKVAFENMDNRKERYQRAEEFETLFSENEKYKLVLDVNHIYTNDRSMKMALPFYEKFNDRIAQVHLSGYETLHDPIFKTKQTEIIKAIQNLNVPIIIESHISADDLEKERNYILGVISEA